ncbi:MAG TPA: type II toxin-antitoxin system VapC family toxin [Rhizomicrobium sp.]|nr:type II toxin-antitoxin system VapC family toxin [Rhizomicrobium sp.]
MIVIDTNVLSEFACQMPEPAVVSWLSDQNSSTLCTTSITEAELLAGIALLPAGRRRAELEMFAAATLQRFESRILPFDREAAREYPGIVAARRAVGLSTGGADCQIAAIARVYGASIATRNVRDFRHCGVDIINPWATPAKQKP